MRRARQSSEWRERPLTPTLSPRGGESMWCRIVVAANGKFKADGAARMKAELVTGRFFMERMLPETAAHLARIQAGSA